MPSRNFLRKMYSRYKGSFRPTIAGSMTHHEEAWYSLRGPEEMEQKPRVAWNAGPAVNRFRHIHHPGNLRRAVRKEMRRILKPTNTRATNAIGGILRYVATSTAIFAVLLFAFNFQAYGNVISYWWTTNFGGTQAQQAFAFVEKPTLLPIPEAQAQTSSPTLSPDNAELPINPPDNRIMIPKIGQNIPIKEVDSKNLVDQNWHGLEEDIQEGLKDGVVHYPGTALPGQRGNVFITGHSSYYLWDPGRYKDVFALLHELVVGDTITVFYNENRYDYKVTEIKVVHPNEVDVLQQTDGKRLTLMTCTPIGTALNRLIVIAEQVE